MICFRPLEEEYLEDSTQYSVGCQQHTKLNTERHFLREGFPDLGDYISPSLLQPQFFLLQHKAGNAFALLLERHTAGIWENLHVFQKEGTNEYG
jgi:hypothetical protein